MIYKHGWKSGYLSWTCFLSYWLDTWLLPSIWWLNLCGPSGTSRFYKRIRFNLWYRTKFGHHIIEIINKCYSVLSLIYINFKYMSSDTFVMLYKALVRFHPEYATCVWSSYRQMDIEKNRKDVSDQNGSIVQKTFLWGQIKIAELTYLKK